MTDLDTSLDDLRGLLNKDATPDSIRPWADQARRRAEWFTEEAVRLHGIADALYRWCAMNGGKP